MRGRNGNSERFDLLRCVINATQIKSVDKSRLKEKIGTLSAERLKEVYEGLKFVTDFVF